MALQEEETQQHPQNAPFSVLDGLYCEEESSFEESDLVEINDDGDLSEKLLQNSKNEIFLPLGLLEHDFYWDDDELLSLISKEKETNPCFFDKISDEFLVLARKEAVDWIFRVKSHYGFGSLTTVLAVNYFDRFITGIRFQTEKPWMSQLVAVACLSLAAKVEEIKVPLLLDLRLEEARYVFEAKTIQRMELLVLCTLQWRMHPVTPISFFDHVIRRFGSKTNQHCEFMSKCERLLLSLVPDARFVSYLPSVLAMAIMVYVIKEIEQCNEVEYQNQLMSVLKINQEKVDECYELILVLMGNHNQKSNKRKHTLMPTSPTGVFDASFSPDSSNDSWVCSASVSSSPEPQFKRSKRIQEQQMKLPPINRLFLDMLSSPR